MSSLQITHIVRIVAFLLIQTLVFKQINLGTESFNYIQIIVYPVAIMLLPVDLPKVAVLLIAFINGLLVDVFYDSIGLHAAALVFMAFVRPFVLNFLSPDTGYNKNTHPVANSLGLIWYLQYSGILIFTYLFVYFSLEAFTFVYIGTILAKTFFSFLVSFAMLILHQILMNPKR